MPEGPEIRKAADQVERAIASYPVSEVFFAFDHLKPYAAKLAGRQVEAVQTHGKAMLIRFDNALSIYSHNQLYGKWMVRNAYSYPETNRQLRLAIHNEKKSALLYSASDIAVLTPLEVEQHPFLSQLGPDVLDRTLTSQAIQDRLKSLSHQRRQFTTLFLDQHFLAGIGNYLRSEILFVARLHPRRKPVDCTDEELLALGEATIAVPCQSYQHGGITNDLSLAAQLKAEGVSRRQYRHWVFNRDGKPCFVCGAAICKDFASSRRFYYCPVCQPRED